MPRFSRGEYRHLPRVQSVVSLMTAAAVVPVACLSIINHQEARFLIPILLPVVLLHGTKLQSGPCISNPFEGCKFERFGAYLYDKFLGPKVAKTYLKLWYIINVALTIFFGFLHQGGVVQVAQHFNKNVLPTLPHDVTVHLVTSHVYNIPMSLLFMPSSKRMFTNPRTGHKYTKERNLFLHEHGAMNMTDLYRRMKLLMDINEYRLKNAEPGKKMRKYKIYLAIPASLSDQLNVAFYQSNTTIMQYRQVKVFYPHLSTEAWPNFWIKHPCEVNTDFNEIDTTCDASERPTIREWLSTENFVRGVSSVVHQFGLVLYQIHMNHPSKTSSVVSSASSSSSQPPAKEI